MGYRSFLAIFISALFLAFSGSELGGSPSYSSPFTPIPAPTLPPTPQESIIPAPSRLLFDEGSILDQKSREVMEDLLTEHERLTGQKVMVAVLKDLPGRDLQEWTHRLFIAWKTDSGAQSDGILAIVPERAEARIEVGYGLESELTDADADGILTEIVIPKLKNKRVKEALLQGIYSIFESLNSPLIQSGKADELLESEGLQDSLSPDPESNTGGWIALFVLGLLALFSVLYQLLSREALFDGEDWHRPRPWPFHALRHLMLKVKRFQKKRDPNSGLADLGESEISDKRKVD